MRTLQTCKWSYPIDHTHLALHHQSPWQTVVDPACQGPAAPVTTYDQIMVANLPQEPNLPIMYTFKDQLPIFRTKLFLVPKLLN
jgi:hypothetical protein